MAFREECTRFLDSIVSLRSTAINNAVNNALQNEHIPYERGLIARRDALITERRTKLAEIIRTMQADLEKEIAGYNEETSKAIEEDKNRVIADATEKAKAEYDRFILGVGKLVDETKL